MDAITPRLYDLEPYPVEDPSLLRRLLLPSSSLRLDEPTTLPLTCGSICRGSSVQWL